MDLIVCDRCQAAIERWNEPKGGPDRYWMTVEASRWPGGGHPANKLRHNLCPDCFCEFKAFVASKVEV